MSLLDGIVDSGGDQMKEECPSPDPEALAWGSLVSRVSTLLCGHCREHPIGWNLWRPYQCLGRDGLEHLQNVGTYERSF